jgi:hypothetical protein
LEHLTPVFGFEPTSLRPDGFELRRTARFSSVRPKSRTFFRLGRPRTSLDLQNRAISIHRQVAHVARLAESGDFHPQTGRCGLEMHATFRDHSA